MFVGDASGRACSVHHGRQLVIGMSDYHSFCERHAARCAEMRAEEENFQRVMEASSTYRQRSGASNLVYKTFETPAAQRSEPAKVSSDVMFYAVAEALALQSIDMRKHVAKEISELREEIAGLRAEMTIMRTINANRNVLGVVRREAKSNVA
jgi:hypothetical protein